MSLLSLCLERTIVFDGLLYSLKFQGNSLVTEFEAEMVDEDYSQGIFSAVFLR